MAEEACLQVATIGGWQAREVAGSIKTIEGVKKVDPAEGDPATLVVAIEGGSVPDLVIKEIGRVPGVIFAGLVGNGD